MLGREMDLELLDVSSSLGAVLPHAGRTQRQRGRGRRDGRTTNLVDREGHPVVWTTRMTWRPLRWFVMGAIGWLCASPAEAQATEPTAAERLKELRDQAVKAIIG